MPKFGVHKNIVSLSPQFLENNYHKVPENSLKQRNKTLAAISISIPVFRATKEKIADVTRILLNARSRIEQELNTLQDINIGIDSHH